MPVLTMGNSGIPFPRAVGVGPVGEPRAGVVDPDTAAELMLSGSGRPGRRLCVIEERLSSWASSRIGLDARLVTRLAIRLPMRLGGRVATGEVSPVPGAEGKDVGKE